MARRDKGRNRYQRTDRLGELLREIVAEELMRIDDDDLQLVTVSGVEVDNELYQATVYLSALDLQNGVDLQAADRHRNRLRSAINRQAHLRKTPRLRFEVDPGMIQGNRVDQILREMDSPEQYESGDAELSSDSSSEEE